MARKRRIYFPSQEGEYELPRAISRKEESLQVEERKIYQSEETPIEPANDDVRYRNNESSVVARSNDRGRLETRLEQLLESNEKAGLVGVFGMYADDEISSALNSIRNQNLRFLGNIDIQNPSFDIYDLIAASILREAESRANGYSTDWYRVRQLYYKLEEACPSRLDDNYDYYSSLERLENLNNRLNRAEKLKEVINDLKETFRYPYNTKFVFVINVRNNFTYKLISALEELREVNVIFIIQSLMSRDIQALMLGTSVGLNEDYSVFYKFFSFENVFITEHRIY